MWIDIGVVLILIIGLVRGWQQGLIISIFSTLSWIAGVIIALKFCHSVAVFFEKQFGWHSAYLPVISFVIVFIITAVLVYLLGKSLEKVVEIAQLGIINKIAGALLRGIMLTFAFSMFIWLINQAGWISPELKAQSKTYSLLASYGEWASDQLGVVLPFIKQWLKDIEQFFSTISFPEKLD